MGKKEFIRLKNTKYIARQIDPKSETEHFNTEIEWCVTNTEDPDDFNQIVYTASRNKGLQKKEIAYQLNADPSDVTLRIA